MSGAVFLPEEGRFPVFMWIDLEETATHVTKRCIATTGELCGTWLEQEAGTADQICSTDTHLVTSCGVLGLLRLTLCLLCSFEAFCNAAEVSILALLAHTLFDFPFIPVCTG